MRASLRWIANAWCLPAVMVVGGCSQTPVIDSTVVDRVRTTVGPEHAPHVAARWSDDKIYMHVAGSGTFIAPGLLVTCAHVVLEPHDDVFINGKRVASVTLARGKVPPTTPGQVPEINKPQYHSGEADYDWTILGLEPGVTPDPLPYIVDRGYRPAPGQTIVLAGRPIGDQMRTVDQRVVETAFVLVAAMVIEQCPEEVVRGAFVAALPTRFDLVGMSGGPALAYDGQRGTLVLFGITCATVTNEVMGITVNRHAVVRTLTFLDEAAATWKPDGTNNALPSMRPLAR